MTTAAGLRFKEGLRLAFRSLHSISTFMLYSPKEIELHWRRPCCKMEFGKATLISFPLTRWKEECPPKEDLLQRC